MPYDMTTLSQAMNTLLSRGINVEFKNTPMGFTYNDIHFFQPHELCIVKTYRFESMSDPSDTSILFVIKILENNILGFCLDAFGVYTNHDIHFHEFIKKISICRESLE